MSKGMQTILGVIVFLLMAFPVVGIIIGVGEADAFNVAKVEHIQRVRETGHDSSSVSEYEEHMNKRLNDYKIKVTKVEDADGGSVDSEIGYGDIVEVEISAKGSGLFGFKKSKKKVEDEGREEGDNLPEFKTKERIIIDRRDE